MKRSPRRPGIVVTTGSQGLVSHAWTRLLCELADDVGLTALHAGVQCGDPLCARRAGLPCASRRTGRVPTTSSPPLLDCTGWMPAMT